MKLLYQQNFDLQEAPFSIAPDPRFLYFSRQHQEALAHLRFGLESGGGFVLLTGEIGTGKTTLCRLFLQQLGETTEAAFIINPMLTPSELVQTICEELGVQVETEATSGTKPWLDKLNIHLLEAHRAGRSVIVVIDEAQNLSTEALEQTRLLTNLETDREKLLRIVLLGQPELTELLSQQNMAQLAQRITVRYHLKSLLAVEVHAYLKHRFSVAGGKGLPFTKAAIWLLARQSGRIPRKLNVLADRALLGAYAQSKNEVTFAMVRQAARETQKPLTVAFKFLASITVGLAALALIMSLAFSRGWLDYGLQQTGIFKDAGDIALWPDSEAVLAHASAYETAFQKLFSYWHAPVNLHHDPCGSASDYGLGCLRMQGDWSTLLKINRPALLAIRHPDIDQLGWLPVVAGSSQTFTLDSQNRRRQMDVARLKAAWTGHFLLLWQLPPHYKQPFAEGAQNASVIWLRNRLLTLGYEAVPKQQLDFFDQALTEQLKQFQGDQGLKVDGIAGPLTLIAINSSTVPSVPKLQKGRLES